MSKRRLNGDAEGFRAEAILSKWCSIAACSPNGRRQRRGSLKGRLALVARLSLKVRLSLKHRFSDAGLRLTGVLSGVRLHEDVWLLDRERLAVLRQGPLGTVTRGCQARPRETERPQSSTSRKDCDQTSVWPACKSAKCPRGRANL